MRFPYFQISPRDFAPIVPISLKGKSGWLEVEAYIDSGASFSIFHSDKSDILGIDYTKGKPVYLTVGDGGLLEVYLVEIWVKLAAEEFLAIIGFSPRLGAGFNLLGRKSFFEYFRICFDDVNRVIELIPHKTRS